jgi:hypothetical protein
LDRLLHCGLVGQTLGRRILLVIGLILLLIVIIAAYLDGGEEPVRPIEQAVAVPPLTTLGADDAHGIGNALQVAQVSL